MPRNLQYYRPSSNALDANSIMISGFCPTVKAEYLRAELRTASRNKFTTVIIDFSRTGDFSSILNTSGYNRNQTFITGRDNYRSSYITIRDAVLNLRTHAQSLGYKPIEIATMTSFLALLQQIESTGDKSLSVQKLLNKFRTQQDVEEYLSLRIRAGEISRRDAEITVGAYLERASSGLTADVLLSEIEFISTPDFDGSAFSIADVPTGNAVVMCASRDNAVDTNDYMMRLWTSDLIGLSESRPLLVVVNSGIHSQITRSYELIETLSHVHNCLLFYAADDIFSGAGTQKVKAFSKLFTYNLYGTHDGDSASLISSIFGEHWITHYSYTETRDRRLLSENVLDILFKTDYSTASTATLTKESIYPAEDIINMSPRDYIIYNTKTHTLQTAFI